MSLLFGDFLDALNCCDWRRLRALCVERLRLDKINTFMAATKVIDDINEKMRGVHECQFSEKYLTVEEDNLIGALRFREENGLKYIYLKNVFEDEREIEKQLRQLAQRPNIELPEPVTERDWHGYLYDPDSHLANTEEYEKALQEQIEVCQRIFVCPISVLSGEAGTGKTTVIKAIIQAIEKAHGCGTSFQLLAPTGKATDRLREVSKDASTIHSFLVNRKWQNNNKTFKKSGGKGDNSSIYIIDEASMLDMNLMATLFRAIDWELVKRLILVGDPNQLPPIGRGRVFVDIVDWLMPENMGILETNLRQMENRLKNKGNGILELASFYTRETDKSDEDLKAAREGMLSRVEKGRDVADDLRVLYWKNPEDLEKKLIGAILDDMEEDTGDSFDENRPYDLWYAAFMKGSDDGNRKPENLQVLSPFHDERSGIDSLNRFLQQHANGLSLEKGRKLECFAWFDKVIQSQNRKELDVYNGEMGFVSVPPKKDKKAWESGFRPQEIKVRFSGKEVHPVKYLKSNVNDNLELAYAISIHKSQGSEFDRVYLVLPQSNKSLLSRELFYTGLTRATRHCTLLIEKDISILRGMLKVENSRLARINSSLFSFRKAVCE